jgi:23S rRNA (guanosine2251-2'-O)-methyltransferase
MNKLIKSELAYGIHPVEEIIKSKKRKVHLIYAIESKLVFIKKLAAKVAYPIEIKKGTRTFLDKICGCSDHQGVACYVDKFHYRKIFFDSQKHPLIVIFDGIQDPRNLGALIRSAYCSNVSGVIIGKKNSSPLSPAAFKSSAGLAENIDIYEDLSSLSATRSALKNGYKIYLADFGGEPINIINIGKEPICLIIGSEGFGVKKELRSMGTIVSIPQKRIDISYNASVAGGIIMFNFASKLGFL